MVNAKLHLVWGNFQHGNPAMPFKGRSSESAQVDRHDFEAEQIQGGVVYRLRRLKGAWF